LDFELYLSEKWCADRGKRQNALIPEGTAFRKKWQIALDMIERVDQWSIPKGIVTADAGYGLCAEFRTSLRKLGHEYVLAVPEHTAVYYPASLRKDCVQMCELAKRLPAQAWETVTWREGGKGPLRSRFAAVRATAAHGYEQSKKKEEESWAIIEWPEEALEPENFYLSSLGADTSIEELVYIAKIRWYIEQNYQQLKTELGMDQFEGRTFQGWHHHVTLALMAFAFLTLERLRLKKNYWVDASTGQT
jgi:SRSO17 transposase